MNPDAQHCDRKDHFWFTLINYLRFTAVTYSIVDRHRFLCRSGSKPEFPFSDARPDPDRHQHDAHPHADPMQSFKTQAQKKIFFKLAFTAVPVHIGFPFSSTTS
jgi:hypothetical protein